MASRTEGSNAMAWSLRLGWSHLAMPSRDPNLTSRLLAICALLAPFIGCAGPERGHANYEPWGGIDIDDDEGEASGDEGQEDEEQGEGSGASAGDEDGDDGPGGDDGPPDGDSSGGEEPPPEEEPPGSPYVGGWDIGDCQDEIVPTGTGVGQVVPDLLLYDQFGDQVRLHDFCHEAVYIVGGAFW